MKNKIKINLLYICISFVILCALTVFVMFITNSRELDMQILKYIQGMLTFYPEAFAVGVSHFGGDYYLFWPQLTAVSVLFSHKKYFEGILLVIFTQIAWHGLDFIKDIIARERPCGNLHSGYSFPSGHANTTMFFYGTLIYLVQNYVKNKFWKYFLISIFSIFIFLVAISRLKLNVHFTTDVLAGLSVGVILMNIYIIILKIFKK